MMKIENIIKNRKGSLMFEFFVLFMVGLVVLAGILLFMDSSKTFLKKSTNRIQSVGDKNGDVNSLGTFSR